MAMHDYEHITYSDQCARTGAKDFRMMIMA